MPPEPTEPIINRPEQNSMGKRYVLYRNKILPFTILLCGILFIIVSTIGYFSGRVPSSYHQTTGTIVSIKTKEVRRPGNANIYDLTSFPTITYSVNDQYYQMTGNGSTDTYGGEQTIGRKVSVSYDPANPANSPKLTADKGPLVGGIGFGIFGFVLIILSIYLFHRNKRSNINQDSYGEESTQPISQSANPNGVPMLALVAGYMAPFAIIIVPAPFVLIMGILAVSSIKKHPGSGGTRRSWLAVVLGLIGTLVLIYGVYISNSRH